MKTTIQIRTAIRRQRAETYLLLTLLSFAASVSFTRLFLDLTGYPQLGGGELHIAHVLWGGLFLFVATLLPLIFANRWVFLWVSILSGVGVGLFIDEVGKFITQSNDYFYPAAAPIIYVFFLLTVLVYVLVRRPRQKDPRADFYHILEDLEEVLDQDLSARERENIHRRLKLVEKESGDPNLARLSRELQDFIQSDQLILTSETIPLWKRIQNRMLRWEQAHLTRARFRALLVSALVLLGTWSILSAALFISNIYNPSALTPIFDPLVRTSIVRSEVGISMFGARVGLIGSTGLALLISAALLFIGKERRAVAAAYATLLVCITIVDLLVFYFDQFSAIILSLVQFTLLLLTLRYRSRYINPEKDPLPISEDMV